MHSAGPVVAANLHYTQLQEGPLAAIPVHQV